MVVFNSKSSLEIARTVITVFIQKHNLFPLIFTPVEGESSVNKNVIHIT